MEWIKSNPGAFRGKEDLVASIMGHSIRMWLEVYDPAVTERDAGAALRAMAALEDSIRAEMEGRVSAEAAAAAAAGAAAAAAVAAAGGAAEAATAAGDAAAAAMGLAPRASRPPRVPALARRVFQEGDSPEARAAMVARAAAARRRAVSLLQAGEVSSHRNSGQAGVMRDRVDGRPEEEVLDSDDDEEVGTAAAAAEDEEGAVSESDGAAEEEGEERPEGSDSDDGWE